MWAPWALRGFARHARLDQAPRLVEPPALGRGEGVHAPEPPVVAVVRREPATAAVQLLLALLAAAEADQAEDAGRTARAPSRRADTAARCSRVAASASTGLPSRRERDRIDVALLARGGGLRELARPRRGLARRLDVGVEEEAAREGDVREGERRIGLDRAAEVLAPAGGRGQDAVGAGDVGVASRLRGRGNGQVRSGRRASSLPRGRSGARSSFIRAGQGAASPETKNARARRASRQREAPVSRSARTPAA